MDRAVIWVVDDNKLILRLLEITLSKDYDVFTTLDTLTAINRLREKERPNLIITDLKMPVLNGIEFTSFLNKTPSYREIPIMIISSYSEKEIIEQCKNLKIIGFLTKPFDPLELKKKIKGIPLH